jgi:hypothetical protein
MGSHGIHICSFDSTGDLKGKNLTYEKVKAIVLEVGRFSVFEATATTKHANIFTRLCKDPELEIIQMGYPWTGVRLKTKPSTPPAETPAVDE